MELTEKTLTVLKNYATINPNVVLNSGNVIKTISEAKNVLSAAEVDVDFPKEVGIYDLSEFLSVLSLVDSPRLAFEENNFLISDGSGRTRIKYFYSDIDMLTVPTKDINMPDCEVSFLLDRDTLSRVKRASSVLGHTQMSLSVVEDVLRLSVIDQNDKTSNVYSIDVEGEYKDPNFNFVFNISNLKMVEGDYRVDISSKLISHFVNETNDIQYWVALEKTSTYGE
jgi:hypothetical protein